MNLNDIKKMAEIMRENSLTELQIIEDGTEIRMARGGTVVYASEPAAQTYAPQITGAPTSELRNESASGKIIKSPTVGVFFSSSTPDGSPYVNVGSTVKAGDVLCIIEAMKLMNEITSDVDGEIAEVLAGNGQVVEFGQPLFRIN